MWVIPKLDGEFISRMEEILDLYAKPRNPQEPVICFDEKSKQLLEDTRVPLPQQLGKPLKRDYAYKRNGTCNIFLCVEPRGGHREVIVTKRRTKQDFAKEIYRLVKNVYRHTKRIHLVLDNLNTHFWKSFEQTLGKKETELLQKRICFHYTPKHASWLNMAEIELSILGRQCLNRRIPTQSMLNKEITSWQTLRNANQAKITWKFTTKDARNVFKYNNRQN